MSAIFFMLGALLGFIFGVQATISYFNRTHSCKRDGHKFSVKETLTNTDSDFATCGKCGQRVNIMEKL